MLVSADRLEALLGVALLTAQQHELLQQASNLVSDEGDPEWDVDTVPDRAADIVLQVAYRAAINPDGHSQASIGDVSVSYRSSGGEGAVYLTRREHRTVRRLAGTGFVAAQLADPYPARVGTFFAGGE